MRWRKLKIDLEQTIKVLEAHQCKTFHAVGDRNIRVEAKLGGDPIMVILPYEDDVTKQKIMDRLRKEGFIESEIVIEPDF